ncbi:MAG TPA: hypothetical protein VIJ31_05510 [Acidothermaceae bacterium]
MSTPSEPPVDPWAVPLPVAAPAPGPPLPYGPPPPYDPPPGNPHYGPPPGYPQYGPSPQYGPQYGPPAGYAGYGLPPQPQMRRTFRPLDGGVIALAGAAFVASFLPYVGLSLKFAGLGAFNYTTNAWHSFAIVGLLALFAAGAATIVGVFASTIPAQRVGFGIAAASAAALGTLLVLVRGLSYGLGVKLQWGGWVLILVGAAQTVCAIVGAATAAKAVRATS